VIAGVVVLVLMPLLVSGLPPWVPAVGAAVVLILVYLWQSPRTLTVRLVPWQLVVFASGLFLAVGALEALGSQRVVEVIAGSGDSLAALLQFAGVGMLGANVMNNLPAYLALEAAANTPERLAALLVGVNAGPLITPWASLATLLWHQRLHAVGIDVPWRRYVLFGLVAAPLTVGLAVIPLALR
jgi:arsenical pump membrane protein